MTTVAADIPLPAPIRSYVIRYVKLRRRHALLRSLGIAIALTIGWVLACCVADRAWPLPVSVRASLLAINVFVVMAILIRPLRRWVRRGVDWRAAAADIECRDARFAQRLQTVTSELLAPPQQRASAQLVAYLAGELNAELDDDDPRRLLPKRPVVRPWLAAGALAVLLAALALVPGLGLPTLLVRYAAPFASVAPPTTTRLSVEPRGIDLVEGQTVSIEAHALRAGDGGATLHYTKPGQPWAEFPMRPARPERFDAILGPVDGDIRYYVTAGDARSDTYTIRVVKRPTIREFRIDYVYPPHLNRPPATAVNTDGFIEAPVGTEATVTVAASEPLASASLATSGPTLALTRGERPETFRGTFRIDKSTTYTIEMVSASNVAGAGERTMRISAIPDEKPTVALSWPTSDLRLRPRDAVTLQYEAADDHGVAALTVRATRAPGLADFSGGQPNLALRRPTTQSTTALGAGADRAVDGNTNGDFHAGSVTHTEMQPNPWWQVDLGDARPVSRVQVWNRADAAPERLADAVVFVGDVPIASDDPAAMRKQQGVSAFDLNGVAGRPTNVDVLRPARFVRVQLQRSEYLSLAEVRVLGIGPHDAPPSMSTDAAIVLEGDPRRRAGRVSVSLATLGVRLGDIVTLSIVATDTAGQTVATEPLRIYVMPHSSSPDAPRRAAGLHRAAEVMGEIAALLVQATATPAPATQPTAAPAAAHVGRQIVRAGEQAAALRPVLTGVIADALRGRPADTVAAAIDACVTTAAVAEDVYRKLGTGGVPASADLKRLAVARDAAEDMAKRLRAIADAELAAGLLADVRNAAALDAAVPVELEQLAALRREQESLRSDVAARLKSAGIESVPNAEAQLYERIRAADEPPPSIDFTSEPALVSRRLALASRVEALRADVDPIRSRDLRRAARAEAVSAPVVDALRDAHAVRRTRAVGGIVLVRDMWHNAVARAARARLPDDGVIKSATAERLSRLRVEQVSLLRSPQTDVAHRAARQEEIAANLARLVRAQHTLSWGGQSPSDSRLEAIAAIDRAMNHPPASERAMNELARTLRPHQPETIPVMREIEEDLRPALVTDDVARSAAALAKVQAALAESLRDITADDPLLEAYAGASGAAAALRDSSPMVDAAVTGQRRAAAALWRAMEAAERDAVRAAAEPEPSIASPLTAARAARAPAGAATTRAADPSLPPPPVPSVPGYDDALRAYFEAINRETPAQ